METPLAGASPLQHRGHLRHCGSACCRCSTIVREAKPPKAVELYTPNGARHLARSLWELEGLNPNTTQETYGVDSAAGHVYAATKSNCRQGGGGARKYSKRL